MIDAEFDGPFRRAMRAETEKYFEHVLRENRSVLELIARPTRSFEFRDRVMALYAPLALLTFPAVALVIITICLASMAVGLALLAFAT